MNIFEYQAKSLLQSQAVSIPPGEMASQSNQVEQICKNIPSEKWVIKAQIRSGGRGEGHFENDSDLSGVQFADSPAAAQAIADKMLNNVLHTGQTGKDGVKVQSVYVEKSVEFEKQLSLSIVVDTRINSVVLLISKIAGGHIESIATENPQMVFSVPVDLDDGIDQQQLNEAFAGLELESKHYDDLQVLIDKLLALFIEKDASLVEINPLVIADGEFVALDAKIAFDNNALYRHEDIQKLGRGHSFERSEDSLMASRDGYNYTELDGNVGILSVGAGLSLATIDAVKHWSGEPANFLDLPPDSRVVSVRSALEMLLSKPNVKSVLINVFGGGIMRCDAIVDAMLLINKEQPLNKVPLVVRLTGINSNVAIRRLKDVIPEINVVSDLSSAARLAVELSNTTVTPVATAEQGGFWTNIKSKILKS